MMKLNKQRIKALIRKDLYEILNAKMVLLPMIVVPVMMAVIVPASMIVAVGLGGTEMVNGVDQFENLMPFYHFPEAVESLAEKLLYIALNFSFLPLFLIIPLMVSSIIAVNAVVGERERGTLETLLYTPLSNRELIVGKLLSAFLPGALIAPAAFILYFGVSNILSHLFFGLILVRAWIWLPALLILSPAVSLLGLGVSLLVSLKAKTFMEAQQMSAMVVLPMVILMIAQLTGVLIFSIPAMTLMGTLLLLGDFLLITQLMPRFDRERLVNRI